MTARARRRLIYWRNRACPILAAIAAGVLAVGLFICLSGRVSTI